MSSEALAAPADDPGEDEYKAFYSVLASSARGRAFLAEHARRARHAETETLLAAIARIEATLSEQRVQAAQPAQPPVAPAATALAAIAAQAIAAAERDLPVMKVIKAGQMPPPARFAGDDFATDPAGSDPAPAHEPSPTPAVGTLAVEMHVAAAVTTEASSERADVGPASNITADGPAKHAAPPDAVVSDALAAILALSEEERLALFS